MDDRFYTPRGSARRGYSSNGSEDERFLSPRTSARSVSSEDNEYVTPRESSEKDAIPALHFADLKPSDYRRDHGAKDTQYTSAVQQRNARKEYKNEYGAYHPSPSARQASARGEVRAPQYAESPRMPENDMFSAARHNRVDSVTYMLDQGMSVNAKDEFGNTVLSIACQNGLKRMAKLALRRGANINSRNVRAFAGILVDLHGFIQFVCVCAVQGQHGTPLLLCVRLRRLLGRVLDLQGRRRHHPEQLWLRLLRWHRSPDRTKIKHTFLHPHHAF